VIFADEPTGSLDSLTSEKVMDQLTGLTKELGTTVVVVTHDARIAAYADRVATVSDGVVSGINLSQVRQRRANQSTVSYPSSLGMKVVD
jgi:putative ABC transport system ATP-binding protein